MSPETISISTARNLMLTVHDEAGYTALRGLLDGPPMWMNDEF